MKMKKTVLVSSVFALAAASAPALAQDSSQGAYIGANYVFATYEEDDVSGEADLGALVAKVGSKITPYFAAELRGGFGVDDDSARVGDIKAELELDYLVGGYGVLGLPNSTPVYPYVVVGFTKGKLTASASTPYGSFSGSASETDVSFGAGANFSVHENVQVNAEYMQYLDKSGAEVTGISVGASYLF